MLQKIKAARILAVDDDVSSLAAIGKVLSRAGFDHVELLSDPLEFGDIFALFQPDLIILDLNMPKVDGLTLLGSNELAEANPTVPVLILTGEATSQVKREALSAGARDFVCKPFDLVELVCRVNNLLESRLLQLQLLEHNNQLERRVWERTRELQDSQLEMVKRLGMAAEYRDDDTGNHVRRMSEYCAVVAQELGMPQARVELVRNASVLHDIGKIAIPDAILLKKGKLTEPEWTVMKSHAAIGAEVMSGGRCELVRVAELIARSHHERWDGGGYPDGLAGDQIPMEARIAAICDVFDALTSERPYKRAWSVDEALEEIRKCSGRQFDPEVVGAFMRVLPEILNIKNSYTQTSTVTPLLVAAGWGAGRTNKKKGDVVA